MKSSLYKPSFLMLLISSILSINSLAEPKTLIITIPDTVSAEEKDKASPPEEEPIKLPEDIRTQLNINVLNESGKPLIIWKAKVKPATQQDGAAVQPWASLEVRTLVRESATIATFHGGPGAKYEYDESEFYLYHKDEDGQPSRERVECTLAPSVLGKVASKSITFFVGKEKGEDVISCLVYYDKG